MVRAAEIQDGYHACDRPGGGAGHQEVMTSIPDFRTWSASGARICTIESEIVEKLRMIAGSRKGKLIMDERVAALERFVRENPELDKLEMLLSEFNFFEAIGVARQELRHSDFLAFLLNSRQSHGMGDIFLKGVLHRIVRISGSSSVLTSVDVDTWSFMETEVRREWLNIDLLLINRINKVVIVIENKLDSSEHSGQLQRYRHMIERSFPDYKLLFVLLSRHGVEASDPAYVSVGYSDILEALDRLIETSGTRINGDILIAIEHYRKLLRRHVVDNSQIAEMCRRIYQRHRSAIDLIIQHKFHTQEDVYRNLLERIQSDDRFILEQSNQTYIRFTVPEWDVPGFTSGRSHWLSSWRLIVFEFQNYPDKLTFGLIVGPGTARVKSVRDILIQTGQEGGEPFQSLPASGKSYQHLYLHQIVERADYEVIAPQEIFQRINLAWDRFVELELPLVLKTMEPAIAHISAFVNQEPDDRDSVPLTVANRFG
ncbi:MAG: PD-(D/E)XK nuclease family protein [Thermomicrobiales bacterium]